MRSTGQYPHCYFYANGEDKLSPGKVFLVAAEATRDKLPRPENRYGNIIEFITHVNTYGADTSHWFFDLNKMKLSNWYHDVKAINGTLIVYPSWVNDGTSTIVVCDMFDYKKGRREIVGDFSYTQEEKFLIAAEFRDGFKIWVKYILQNGNIDEAIVDLDDVPVVTTPIGL